MVLHIQFFSLRMFIRAQAFLGTEARLDLLPLSYDTIINSCECLIILLDQIKHISLPSYEHNYHYITP